MASKTSSIDELQEDLRGNASWTHMLRVAYPGTPSVVAVWTSLGSIAGMFTGMHRVSGFSPSGGWRVRLRPRHFGGLMAPRSWH